MLYSEIEERRPQGKAAEMICPRCRLAKSPAWPEPVLRMKNEGRPFMRLRRFNVAFGGGMLKEGPAALPCIPQARARL